MIIYSYEENVALWDEGQRVPPNKSSRICHCFSLIVRICKNLSILSMSTCKCLRPSILAIFNGCVTKCCCSLWNCRCSYLANLLFRHYIDAKYIYIYTCIYMYVYMAKSQFLMGYAKMLDFSTSGHTIFLLLNYSTHKKRIAYLQYILNLGREMLTSHTQHSSTENSTHRDHCPLTTLFSNKTVDTFMEPPLVQYTCWRCTFGVNVFRLLLSCVLLLRVSIGS